MEFSVKKALLSHSQQTHPATKGSKRATLDHQHSDNIGESEGAIETHERGFRGVKLGCNGLTDLLNGSGSGNATHAGGRMSAAKTRIMAVVGRPQILEEALWACAFPEEFLCSGAGLTQASLHSRQPGTRTNPENCPLLLNW